MVAMFLLQGDDLCTGAARDSRGTRKGSSGVISEREGEECSTRIVNAEELRRAWLEN